MAILTNKQFIGVAVVGVVGVFILKGKIGNFFAAVNPLDNDNVIYTGVNAIGGRITGSNDFSLGSWIYDKTHDDVIL